MRPRSVSPAAATVAALALLLTGCDGSPAPGLPRADERSSTASPTAPPAAPAVEPPALRRSDPLVQDLWRPVPELGTLATTLPASLDLDAIDVSRTLSEAPVDAAVLAVGIGARPYGMDDVAVLGRDGGWRLVDRSTLGMRDDAIVEQQFLLSPDGRMLALGDDHGIVLVRLATGRAVRVATPFQQPVLHWWDPDGSAVVLSDRRRQRDTWEVRLPERTATPHDHHGWSSAVGPSGGVVELVPNIASPGRSTRPAHAPFTGLRASSGGRAPDATTPLSHALPHDAHVGHRAGDLLGVAHGHDPEGRRTIPGVSAVDLRSGELVGLLEMSPRQLAWTSVEGVLGDRWLLLHSPSGPDGGLVAWDPVAAELRSVMAIEQRATVVSIADRLLERRAD
ncbi:hypothetical protein QWY28_21410 [Nocardioides sp. SOB77]|uniref:WD40 repeat domain-containing protein n=1 Tax=Nocardioides oceani TaxID=3058369 RepID=A0ABT8FLI2_9ACTN|nr:hypothetical protein [Nocardioides oceani]MDN4175536.1 hypothetical protein [Nocardioides oceani]